MRISELGEFGLIDLIARVLGTSSIGDDCASVEIGDGFLLMTGDSMVEGVHFLSGIPPESLGWKAVSVNVSDVVSSGGTPRWLLSSLILPDLEVSFVERLYEGMKRACEFYGCEIVGGNISKGEKIIIDLFAVGKTNRVVSRRGARAGDSLFVSGTLGDSRAGLELLRERRENYKPHELALIERHVRPTARVDYIRHIVKYAGACIDISDGLLQDAGHLSRMSGVRIDIEPSRVPISKELRRFCEERGREPLEYALSGGEDYQLLFTHSAGGQNPFLDMTLIGEVSEGEGVYVGGKRMGGGYTHF